MHIFDYMPGNLAQEHLHGQQCCVEKGASLKAIDRQILRDWTGIRGLDDFGYVSARRKSIVD